MRRKVLRRPDRVDLPDDPRGVADHDGKGRDGLRRRVQVPLVVNERQGTCGVFRKTGQERPGNFCAHLGHDAPRSDRHAAADPDVWEYGDVPAEPAVVADRDRTAGFGAGGTVPDGGVERVRAGEAVAGRRRVLRQFRGLTMSRVVGRCVGECSQRDVRAEEAAVADPDLAGVEDDEVEIHEAVLADAVYVQLVEKIQPTQSEPFAGLNRTH